ncbi:MAG: hypothetical protein V7K89_01930 [Nostoc sp.]
MPTAASYTKMEKLHTVRRLAGDTKRIKRNRSRDTFKMCLGMGTVLEAVSKEM